MYKNPETGNYEHDFRMKDTPRFRAIYGPRKLVADKLHAAALALFRSKALPVINALKDEKIRIEEIAELFAAGEPFTKALALVPPPAPVKPVNPWPEFVAACALYVKGVEANANRADGTARTAKSQLKSAEQRFAGKRLDEITTDDVTDYQTWMRDDGYAINTVTARMARVGALYRWFIRREAIAAQHKGRAPRPLFIPIDTEVIGTKSTSRERYLKADEVAAVLRATPAGYRFCVAAGLYAGLRGDEMCHLRTAHDVDMARNVIRVQVQDEWRPKTDKSVRTIPIAAPLRPILAAHLATFANDRWVTPSALNTDLPLNRHTFDGHFALIVEAAGLKAGRTDPDGVTFHTLRHTCASHLVMSGSDLLTVANLLGNSVKQIEKTYGHLSQDHSQAAVNRLGAIFTTSPTDAR